MCERRKNSRQTRSICRQQFANVFADCFYAVHTHQLEFANTSLPTLVCRVKTAQQRVIRDYANTDNESKTIKPHICYISSWNAVFYYSTTNYFMYFNNVALYEAHEQSTLVACDQDLRHKSIAKKQL